MSGAAPVETRAARTARLSAEFRQLHALGFHLFPVGLDKRPVGPWAHGAVNYVETPASIVEGDVWAAESRVYGWANLCGNHAAGVFTLDVEVAGMDYPQISGAFDALPASCQRPSPSGGRHAVIRVVGEPVATDSLAYRAGVLLAETRGVSPVADRAGAYAVITGPGRGPLPADFRPHELPRSVVDSLLDMIRGVDDGSGRTATVERKRGPKAGAAAASKGVGTGGVIVRAVESGALSWVDVLDDGWVIVSEWGGRFGLLRPDYGQASTALESANAIGPILVVHSAAVPWAVPGQGVNAATALNLSRFGGDYKDAMRTVEDAAAGGERPAFMASWPETVLEDIRQAVAENSRTHKKQRAAAVVEVVEVVPVAPVVPVELDKAIEVFRRYLHLPDLDPLLVVAAAAVANLSGERSPLWLLVIGPPSSGKTEIISGLTRLPDAVYAATLTESALLSGTAKSERAKDSTGGLLRRIPTPGILVMKDFGSVLAQNRDARASALAALREVYDGSWTRAVGTDGGRLLEWSGKVGLIAGGTPSYDRHHAVIAALGDRFILVRLADFEHDASGLAALTHAGREGTMRQELDDALAGLVTSADMRRQRALTDAEKRELVRLARYTGTARTGVERDGYTGELLVMPEPEGPGRLVVALNQLIGGLWAIGCDDVTAWRIVRRVARDTVPSLRTTILRELMKLSGPETKLFAPETKLFAPQRTSDIAQNVGIVTKSAHRILDDLALIGLTTRTKNSSAGNSIDLWEASELLRDLWPREGDVEQ